MRANRLKNRGRLTSCCCCQAIDLALELEVDPVFRKIGGGGSGGVGKILVGRIKGLDKAQGGIGFFLVEGT